MRKTVHLVAFLLLVILLGCVPANAASGRPQDRASVALSLSGAESRLASPLPHAAGMPTSTLRVVSGKTITFKTQNGETINGVPSQTIELPHLVLYRNGVLTDPTERTLIVEVSGVTVPPTGVTVTLELETQHGNPDLGGGSTKRIPVWRESRRITNSSGMTETGVTATFRHEFTAAVISGTQEIVTPTDYFWYHVQVTSVNHPVADPWYAFDQDYAFLMENQWIARLADVRETPAGAAPDEMIVYYCDMFPFRKSAYDRTTWLPREAVPDYVSYELIPAMIEAVRVQTDDWGFPWYDTWTSYRSGEDAERLSVALVKGGTWFHGSAPSNGHSGISLRVNGDGYAADYDTLADALVSVFHHELFHNLQKSILQKRGDNGDVNELESAWRFFSEGTAVLVPSVGRSATEFGPSTGARHYMENANRYLDVIGLEGGELNRSYQKMSPYHAALYWRFLYEQCGGIANGLEDPAKGMGVIRRALISLYSGDIVDIISSTDLVGEMPKLMDEVLKDSLCPFKTHRESLVAFARAIYGLRVDGGRCIAPSISTGCGFYDPHYLYHAPPVDTIPYAGGAVVYSAADQLNPAGIKSSFGMDFIEVILDPTLDGQTLSVEFYGALGAAAEFNVQVWKLGPGGSKPRAIAVEPEMMVQNADSGYVYTIARVDTAAFNRLALLITRLDSHEAADPVGNYTVRLDAY